VTAFEAGDQDRVRVPVFVETTESTVAATGVEHGFAAAAAPTGLPTQLAESFGTTQQRYGFSSVRPVTVAEQAKLPSHAPMTEPFPAAA
jgi:hypothetical protein